MSSVKMDYDMIKTHYSFPSLFCFCALLFSFISNAQTERECDNYTVYFKNNKSELKGRQLRQLDTLNQKIPSEGTYMIRIVGHTDSKGSALDNERLSGKRAQFIREYIEKKYPERFKIYVSRLGERQPISTNEKFNRRVEIQFFRLNDDGTVSFYSEDSTSIRLNAQVIAGCDLCEIPLKYQLGEPLIEGELLARRLQIDSKCIQPNCLNIEIRLPFDSKLLYSEESIPYPIIKTCGDTAKYVLDTTFKYRSYYNYLKEFQIRIDTASSEFVISHPCFYARQCVTICGFSMNYCKESHFSIDENVEFTRTNIISKKYDTIVPLYSDTHIVFGDSNIFCANHCGISNFPEIVRGYGYINGEIRFLNCYRSDLKFTYDFQKRIYTRSSTMYNKRYHIKSELYRPLEYGNLDVNIKVPKNIGIQNIGLSLQGIEYYVPIDHLNKRWHSTKELMFPHDLYLQFEGEKLPVTYQTAKVKYKRRKNFIKVKIKRKHIQGYLDAREKAD